MLCVDLGVFVASSGGSVVDRVEEAASHPDPLDYCKGFGDRIILHFENLLLFFQRKIHCANIVVPLKELEGLSDHVTVYPDTGGGTIRSHHLLGPIFLNRGEELVHPLCIYLNWL